MEWCPAPDCQYAVEASFTPINRLNCKCKCGFGFCFECRNAQHEPIPCELYKTWLKYMSDSTFQYISKNTKACPKCRCLIEKNMGCVYMVQTILCFLIISWKKLKYFESVINNCSVHLLLQFCPRCQTQFCWICFKKCFDNWKYGHGKCNTPKDKRPKPPETSMIRWEAHDIICFS